MLGFWFGNYLKYGFCMDHMNFKALYGYYLVSKSRVLKELHSHLGFLELRVGKTPYGTR